MLYKIVYYIVTKYLKTDPLDPLIFGANGVSGCFWANWPWRRHPYFGISISPTLIPLLRSRYYQQCLTIFHKHWLLIGKRCMNTSTTNASRSFVFSFASTSSISTRAKSKRGICATHPIIISINSGCSDEEVN